MKPNAFCTRLLLFLTLTFSGYGLTSDKVGFVSDYDFDWAVKTVTTNMNSGLKLQQLEDGSFMEKVKSVENISTGNNQNAWKVEFNSWEFWHTGTIETFITAAVAVNYGDKFEYRYYTHAIPTYYADEISKEVKSFLSGNLLKEKGHMDVDWGVENGKIYINASYAYDGNDKEQARRKLGLLMASSQGLMDMLIPLIDDYKEKYAKLLKDQKIDYLSKSLFIDLMADYIDFSKFEKESGDIKEGVFKLKRSGTYNYDFENHGNKLIFSQWFHFPDGVSADGRAKILKMVKALVDDEGKPKGANRITTELFPGNEDVAFRVSLEYDFTGKYEGDDLYDYLAEYGEEFMTSLHEDIVEIMDEFVGDQIETDISYLSRDLFLLAFSDDGDYSEYEDKVEGVKEGFFAYTWTSENDQELSLEFYNYGDRFTFAQWFTYYADVSDENKQAIVSKLNAFMNNIDKPKYASRVYAVPCPDNESTCIMAAVDYEFKGKFTPKELYESVIDEARSHYFLKVYVKNDAIMDDHR